MFNKQTPESTPKEIPTWPSRLELLGIKEALEKQVSSLRQEKEELAKTVHDFNNEFMKTSAMNDELKMMKEDYDEASKNLCVLKQENDDLKQLNSFLEEDVGKTKLEVELIMIERENLRNEKEVWERVATDRIKGH